MKATVWGTLGILCGSAMMAGAGCGRSPLGSTGSHSAASDANVVATDGDAHAPAQPGPDADVPTQPGPDANVPTQPVPDAASPKDTRVNCTQVRRSSAPCPSSQWYAFQNDRRCFLCANSAEPGCSSTVSYWCMSWGDDLCYLLCKSNADCTDPCFPFCREIVLYGGNDHCGASSRSVCLRADRDTCDPSSEQL